MDEEISEDIFRMAVKNIIILAEAELGNLYGNNIGERALHGDSMGATELMQRNSLIAIKRYLEQTAPKLDE